MAIKAPKIMLDPGHDKAKYNQGAVSEYWEGARMWRLYQILRPMLEARGFVVGGTKTKCDQAIEVSARGRMARGYDVLISLHSNACDDPSVNRPDGIYMVDDNCGKIDDVSKELAKLLSDTVAGVMGTARAVTYSRKSGRDRDGDGKVNDDYYGVLFGAHQVGVPAVILENSFHTNRKAAEWLLKDSNLEKLATALADALAEYYGTAGAAGATPSPAPTNTTTKEGFTVKMQTIKKGAEGAQVRTLQALLIGYGYDCGKHGADGDFGSQTDSALRKYQEATGLTVDGIAGPKTWAKLLGQ